jgi:hypothetical protein
VVNALPANAIVNGEVDGDRHPTSPSSAVSIVGYGGFWDCPSFPLCSLTFDATRRWAAVSYNGHSSFLITLQMNSTGHRWRRFCAGDSGGANFLGRPDSNVIAGVTSAASTCEAVRWPSGSTRLR